jgi:glycosyl transferase family 2
MTREAAPVVEPQDSPNHALAPWFARARKDRRERYAQMAPRGPRSRAVITMVHNEPVFLPLWLRYYSRFFRPDDIYVLDNETSDGSTERDGFVRIPVEHDRVDHTWMVRTIEGLQHDLLGRYDVTLVTDVDEIVAPTPEWGTLGEYLDRFAEDFVNCLGYELLHMRDSEPPLDLSRPVMDQRGWWFMNAGYDKAAIATEPMRWKPGFHGREDFAFNLDPDLRMIHLHRMDYDLCLERHRTRNRRPWAKEDADQGWAVHNQIVDEREFERWFYEDSCFAGIEIDPEPIRPSWRGVF